MGLGKSALHPRSIGGNLGIDGLDRFIPWFHLHSSTDSGDFYIDMEFARGTPLETTHQKALRAEQIVRQAVPEITSMTVFSAKARAMVSFTRKSLRQGLVSDRWERTRSVHAIMLMSSTAVRAVAGSRIEVTNGGYDKLLGYVSGGGVTD
jgi:HAE1 family hydrophobic/amphiphilic exporter-1